MYFMVLILLISVVIFVIFWYMAKDLPDYKLYSTGTSPVFQRKHIPKHWAIVPVKFGKRIIRRHIYLRKPRLSIITKTNSNMNTSRHEREMNSVRSRIEFAIVNQKRYTDPKVSLDALACELGTNRTYMSKAINEEHRKSFKQYINDHRFSELMRQILKNPNLTREELVQLCGFNSISTMVRVVKASTGFTFREWKRRLMDNGSKEENES
jgi:AraC-like DNA-binding protein